MARSRALRRFLRVLELEEEQHRARMASALADLHHLETLLTAAEDRERAGRQLMNESAQTGKVVDRLAGREESQLARKRAALLKPQIADAEEVARAQRESFLEMRIERRQTETVIVKSESADAIEAGRREQRSLDDWFLRRVR